MTTSAVSETVPDDPKVMTSTESRGPKVMSSTQPRDFSGKMFTKADVSSTAEGQIVTPSGDSKRKLCRIMGYGWFI